ncbi:hypothetical protein [Spiroplasma alleghenense]|nr:hypothetical protein [Spiroplasma alleghenense]
MENKKNKDKDKNKIKQKILTISMATTLLASSLLFIPHSSGIYYNFEGRNFSNQSQVVDYALTKANKKIEQDKHYYYKYKGKVYSLEEKNQAIEDMIKDAKVKKEMTYRNVGDYVISNSGELSGLVQQAYNDKLVDVYKGKNGNSYVDLDEAAQSYFDFDEVLLTENLNKDSSVPIEFYNESEMIQYLENSKKESLENGEESDCYVVSGICQDEGSVKKWLKSSSTYKYRYKDYEWSNFAPAEIDKIDLNSQDLVYKENIFPHSGNKNAYWLGIDNLGTGAFSGSQFIETNMDNDAVLNKIKHGWSVKQSDTINIFLSPIVGFGTLATMKWDVEDSRNSEEGKWTILDNVFFGDEEAYENFFTDVESKSGINLIDSISGDLYYENIEKDLTGIGKNMDSQTKTLVFFRKLANASLMKNNSQNEKLMLEFENLCKETLRNVIDTGSENTKAAYDELFKLDNPSIAVDDIINVFLNPAAFQYKDDAGREGFYKFMVEANKVVDAVMAPVDTLTNIVDGTYDYLGKRKKDKLTHQNRLDIIDARTEMIKSTYGENEFIKADDGQYYTRDELIRINESDVTNVDIGADRNIKFNDPNASKLKKITKGFNAVQIAWELGNKLSPFKMKTMSLDFGEGQELLYTYMSFSLPFAGEINKHDPSEYITPTFLYKGVGGKDEKGFRVKGSYFNNETDAINYMKTLMIRNPEEYSQISKFTVSIMDKNEEMAISNDGYTSVEEQLDEFIDNIFKKYYANTKQRYFTDGFGNKFDNQIDAIASMRENISKKNFIRKYQWTDKLGIKRNYDTYVEMKEVQDIYIKNTYIDQKKVISSDLISEIDYNKLDEQTGSQNEYYSLIDGTKKRYFKTYEDACAFVVNKNQFELNIDEVTNIYITYNGDIFESEQSFMLWVKENTKVTNKKGEEINYVN